MNKKYKFAFYKNGYGKKTPIEDICGTTGKDKIMIITQKGCMLFFDENDLRPMSENSKEMKLIDLKRGDFVACLIVVDSKITKKHKLLLVTENGYGKRVNIDDIKIQRRGEAGISVIKTTKVTGNVTCGSVRGDGNDVIFKTSKNNEIKVPIDGVSILSFATQGVRIMRLSKNEKVEFIIK
jgi:DNA gyrase subunit A